MLAYLLWHRPADGIEPEAYEHACRSFHGSLRDSPPVGFRGSAVFRVGELPWLAPAPGGAYEDWYFVEDFSALGVLNEAAVAQDHRGVHDDVARRFGSGAGGLYGLLEGNADLADATRAVWVSRPPGEPRGELARLLATGVDPAQASLWRRALVFGPAPEYCLLTWEPPADAAPALLPEGWRATACERVPVWHG
jgi:hypothetical protein